MRKLIPWLAAPLIGLLTGLAAWLLAGEGTAMPEQAAALERSSAPRALSGAVLQELHTHSLTSRPLFPRLSATGTEPIIQIIGVSVTRRRRAALVAIDGAPPVWIAAGERHDSVALLGINGTQVLIETPLGPKAMQVGERSGEGSVPPAGGSQTVVNQMPPGFRGPPPPADAPGA